MNLLLLFICKYFDWVSQRCYCWRWNVMGLSYLIVGHQPRPVFSRLWLLCAYNIVVVVYWQHQVCQIALSIIFTSVLLFILHRLCAECKGFWKLFCFDAIDENSLLSCLEYKKHSARFFFASSKFCSFVCGSSAALLLQLHDASSWQAVQCQLLAKNY